MLQSFVTTRTTPPDVASVLTALRALDATAVMLGPPWPPYVCDKATPWTGPQIAAAQAVLDTAPAISDQLTAQAQVDSIPIFEKAIVLAIIDALNVIRAALPAPLPPITPAQALAAIRAKAALL